MPTVKQKALAKEIVANSSPDMKTAMIKVGYAEATATHPSQITNTKTWNDLMEKYLPDDKVLATHAAGLDAMKQLSVHGGKDANAESDDFIEVEDHPTRLKAVELAYKVKNKFVNNQINILNQGGDMDLKFSLDA